MPKLPKTTMGETVKRYTYTGQTLGMTVANLWADPIREASKVSSGNNIAAITFRIEVPPYHHGYLMFHPKAVAPAEVKETGGIFFSQLRKQSLLVSNSAEFDCCMISSCQFSVVENALYQLFGWWGGVLCSLELYLATGGYDLPGFCTTCRNIALSPQHGSATCTGFFVGCFK